MKRSKFMIGALVLSMGLLGVGYASWADTLQINSTVNTGLLDVIYTAGRTTTTDAYINEYIIDDEKLLVQKQNNNGEGAITDQEGSDITIKDDVITFETNNMYPGKSVKYTLHVENKGSIPAQLSKEDVKLEFSGIGKDGENWSVTHDVTPDADGDVLMLDPGATGTIEVEVTMTDGEPVSTQTLTGTLTWKQVIETSNNEDK